MENILIKGQEVRHTTRQGKLMIGEVVKQDGQNVYMKVGNDVFKFHIDQLTLTLRTKRDSKACKEVEAKGWNLYYGGKEGRSWVCLFRYNR